MENIQLIEDLQMGKLEKMCFDFGFCGLEIEAALILLEIDQNEFDTKFSDYYSKGLAFGRLTTLQKFMDVSGENSSALMQYMEFRKMIDKSLIRESSHISSMDGPISTAEVIKALQQSQ